jgi:hypothetical protein
MTAPFAVINADDYYGADSFAKIHDHLFGATDRDGLYDYCMVGYELAKTLTEHGHVSRGVCTTTDSGYLSSVVERTKIQRFGDSVRYSERDGEWVGIEPESVVSMNMWGFTHSFMDELERRFPVFLEAHGGEPKSEFFVPSVVNELLSEGKATVRVLPTSDRWFGVTHKEDRQAVVDSIRSLVDAGAYPERLWD